MIQISKKDDSLLDDDFVTVFKDEYVYVDIHWRLFHQDLFNSAFTGFDYDGDFGLFKAERYILFQVE